MMKWRIPLFKIYWDNEDIDNIMEVLQGGSSWADGPSIAEFEAELSDYVGAEFCVTFNSGTSALHSALLAHGIGAGDEVIVPSFTFIASANAPLLVGARPVFADIEDGTWGIDPLDVEKRITSRTKAILPTHYGGCPCRIEEHRKIADDHGLVLIEDAAEALGAQIGGKMAGAFGDAAVLSFCQNKVITTGEGGATLTDSKEIHEKLRLVRSHGRRDVADYFTSAELGDYVALGYNFRMSTIAAALGKAQLGKIERLIQMRGANASYMESKLSRIDEIEIFKTPNEFRHVHQIYTIRVRGGVETRENLRRYLAERGIMTKVYFSPVHLTTFYTRDFGHRTGELPVTERISGEVLTLPMYPTLSEDEMDYIADQIRDFFAGA